MKNYRGFKYPDTMEELKNQLNVEDPEIIYIYLGGITPVSTNVPSNAISSDEELEELCKLMIDEFRNFMGMNEEN